MESSSRRRLFDAFMGTIHGNISCTRDKSSFRLATVARINSIRTTAGGARQTGNTKRAYLEVCAMRKDASSTLRQTGTSDNQLPGSSYAHHQVPASNALDSLQARLAESTSRVKIFVRKWGCPPESVYARLYERTAEPKRKTLQKHAVFDLQKKISGRPALRVVGYADRAGKLEDNLPLKLLHYSRAVMKKKDNCSYIRTYLRSEFGTHTGWPDKRRLGSRNSAIDLERNPMGRFAATSNNTLRL
ncbi:hypothetical protein BJ508DRAFT_310776 [Ascobolus immersus RN42]|uniref:Uncharacterized protein n=1 Tax=Ascobolus immersus RN42 TaxID=1160509 RepID=A0A3N4HXQ3_ASCIM|nr:hypothetical protein BJ508DRAFT_310776 [Ascobolus immersus RN42]